MNVQRYFLEIEIIMVNCVTCDSKKKQKLKQLQRKVHGMLVSDGTIIVTYYLLDCLFCMYLYYEAS